MDLSAFTHTEEYRSEPSRLDEKYTTKLQNSTEDKF